MLEGECLPWVFVQGSETRAIGEADEQEHGQVLGEAGLFRRSHEAVCSLGKERSAPAGQGEDEDDHDGVHEVVQQAQRKQAGRL